MANDLMEVAQLLETSLDPRQNKQAEIALRQREQQPGFSVLLLQIVANEQLQLTTRLASALFFKNFLKRSWTDEDGNHKLPEQEVATIKQEIIGLMTSVPPRIQAQLGEAVAVIADSDFWRRWDTLVDDLVSRLTTDNPTVNNGVLQVAHSIFARWRPLFRSDELFTEINHVLSKFGEPFIKLVENTDNMIQQHRSDPKALAEWFTTLKLIMNLFYDLSCQEIPPVFEDRIGAVSAFWEKYLSFDEPSLHSSSEDEAGPLEFVKSAIFEVLDLYVKQYDEVFGPKVGTFIESTWNLLTTIGLETKYDILVSRGLQFLTSVTRQPQYIQTFNDAANMGQVIEKVILPNLSLRDSDMELFEDEPIEFIRRDLEGSDSDTRRRAATDFLRGLLAQFEELVTQVVLKYTEHFLNDFASDPAQKWRSKDTAIYLYSSIAAKGAVTAREGVKTVNPLVNVIDFFQTNISADLVSDSNAHPVLKVDAIKYLYTFRSQINKEQWGVAFPLLVQHLASQEYVVYTYAAIAVERVLALVDENGRPAVEKTTVIPLSEELVTHLFKLIEKEKTADKAAAAPKIQENEFLMRCVMRVLIVIKEGVTPITKLCLSHMVEILDIVATNPSNPRFCYYLFEAIGAVIRFTDESQLAVVEESLYKPLEAIVSNDLQDFFPYVFQLFAALLEAGPAGTIPDQYKGLIPFILRAEYWLAKGNVPALVRLLSGMLDRAAGEFVSGNQVEPVLGIFKQLFATKANELPGLELLECILSNFPSSAMENYYVPVMQLVLEKLEKSKSESFNIRFVRLYHFISSKTELGLGADFFIRIIDQIQQGIYVPIYLNIVLPTTPKIARPLDRKTAVVSFTRTLTDSAAFAETYKKGWGFTCDRLLELLINPPVVAQADDIMAEHDVDDMSFGVGFTQLVTIKRPTKDNFPEVGNVKTWVGESLKQGDSRHNGRISAFVQERLAPESKQALLAYMEGA